MANSPDLQALIDRYTSWQPGTEAPTGGGWTPSANAAAMMGQGDPYQYWHAMDAGDSGDPAGTGLGTGGGHDSGIPENPGQGGGGDSGSFYGTGGIGGGSNYGLPDGGYSDFSGSTGGSDGAGFDWSSLVPSSQSIENLLGTGAATAIAGPLGGMLAGWALHHYNPSPMNIIGTPNVSGISDQDAVTSQEMDQQSGKPNANVDQGFEGEYGGSGGAGSGSGGRSGGFQGVFDMSGGMSTVYHPMDSFAAGGSVDRAVNGQSTSTNDSKTIQEFLTDGLTQDPRLAQFGQELRTVMRDFSSAAAKHPKGNNMRNYVRAEYLRPLAAAIRAHQFPQALHLMTQLMEEAYSMTQGAKK